MKERDILIQTALANSNQYKLKVICLVIFAFSLFNDDDPELCLVWLVSNQFVVVSVFVFVFVFVFVCVSSNPRLAGRVKCCWLKRGECRPQVETELQCCCCCCCKRLSGKYKEG